MSDSKKPEKSHPRRPWRDNIEAVAMAIIMAVMLKYFIIEAYKIPTGSMQPTLMGNQGLGLEDRILVDKLSYHFTDPERFDVVIFKYPLDRSKNFIKRILGMPGERLRVSNGDVWTAPLGTEDWTILRKPRDVQEEMWKPLLGWGARTLRWEPNSAAKSWRVEDHEIAARGDGTVRYPGGLDSVRDDYKDGYPRKLAARMRARTNGDGNDVGDLRVRGEVTALEGCNEVAFVFEEGGLEYRCVLPGPAAPESAKPRIEAQQQLPGGSLGELRTLTAEAEEPLRLDAGDSATFAAWNLDDRLELELDGEVLCILDVAPASGATSVRIEQRGSGADLAELQVDRDIYYTEDHARFTRWDIPEGSYVMLGDNTQDSSDGREWQLRTFEVTPALLGEDIEGLAPDDTLVLRGNHRGTENPIAVPTPDGHELWFRDEWGELYHWPESGRDAGGDGFVDAPFVPRELITGRAVLVFWPIKPSLDAYRLKWIR